MTCPSGATVLIPAHGVAPGARAEAAARGLAMIDATCPLVAGVQAEARRFAERGDQVVLIGQSGLAVLPAILGEAPDHAILAETRVGAGAVQVADPRRVSYVLVPGVPVEDTPIATAALRSRFPALRGPDPDGFCYAASDRAETIRTVAASSDLVLVLGAEDDADTRHLAALARSNRAKANVIADVTEIIPSWLAGIVGHRPGRVHHGRPRAGRAGDRGAVRARPAERDQAAGQHRGPRPARNPRRAAAG